MLSAIIEMADFREQRACIKFCLKLGKTATECYEMLKTAFGEQAMGRSQTFQWFSRFKAGRSTLQLGYAHTPRIGMDYSLSAHTAIGFPPTKCCNLVQRSVLAHENIRISSEEEPVITCLLMV